jgi:hypothetical protein
MDAVIYNALIAKLQQLDAAKQDSAHVVRIHSDGSITVMDEAGGVVIFSGASLSALTEWMAR